MNTGFKQKNHSQQPRGREHLHSIEGEYDIGDEGEWTGAVCGHTGKTSGLVTHDLEGYEFEKTCNSDKSLSEIQLEHEKEDEIVVVVMKVVHECNRGESFWKEGDDFGVDVLRFITCLTDILGFLENLKWWFEQDIDNEEEEDEEGTDIAKITRKEQKTRQNGHENGKSTQEPGIIKLKSTLVLAEEGKAKAIAFDEIDKAFCRNYEWDYGWMDYPLRARDVKHPCDQHIKVIRCYAH
nr:hypothetical protein [Tanacetum cinerariifolium]